MLKRTTNNQIAVFIIEILILVAVFVTLIASFINLDKEASKEGLNQLESSVRRSCVACYASEGVYPPNIEYLEDNYGLLIDHSKYTVRYSAFAQNIMPDITVLEKTK